MVKTDFAFGFFEDGFDRQTHTADTDKLDQRRVGRCIAEVEFDLGWSWRLRRMISQISGPGKLALDSMTRKKAKSQTMGP